MTIIGVTRTGGRSCGSEVPGSHFVRECCKPGCLAACIVNKGGSKSSTDDINDDIASLRRASCRNIIGIFSGAVSALADGRGGVGAR